jgi:hypothetical protein
VELLAGVGRPPFGAGAIIVRGSSPQDSQAFFEGLPVLQIYHFGGLTSFVNSNFLQRIEFYPGNFGSQFGRKRGGAIGRAGETLGSARDEGSEFNLLKNDPDHDHWYNACSGGGEREYPYGDEGDPERCPGPVCAALGTDPPIMDLLGIMEHQDFCSDDGACWTTGEATGGTEASCSRLLVGGGAAPDLSFRCCYDFEE